MSHRKPSLTPRRSLGVSECAAVAVAIQLLRQEGASRGRRRSARRWWLALHALAELRHTGVALEGDT